MKNSYLGIELGSTRIKAVLIGDGFEVVAAGSHAWENTLENGFWTYSLDEVWNGVQTAYGGLAAEYERRFGAPLTEVGCVCVSAMMHGYLAFDRDENLLVPFRTWRNTNTAAAARRLSEALGFNMPQRWSAAHLFQAFLDGEAHVSRVASLNTLAGYVHFKLTGRRVLGIGDASGMFPLLGGGYDTEMAAKFDALCNNRLQILPLLPEILEAGENAGYLTPEGAALLDTRGALRPGAPFAPPEGDAGTGMTATNSVSPRTCNVSAGTSVFAMAVLEAPLGSVYPELDIVSTPHGKAVAMAHCNNCTSDIDAWIRVFGEFLRETGFEADGDTLYGAFYGAALRGEPDCGGLLAYSYLSGEPITAFAEGRPLLARLPDAVFTLPNLARTLLSSAIATLRLGMDILTEKEGVALERVVGHGGFFKTSDAGRQLMADALDAPVSVYATAGEGGAWGAALLAAFCAMNTPGGTLDDFLAARVFKNAPVKTALPENADGFNAYLRRFVAGLGIERAAVEGLHD